MKSETTIAPGKASLDPLVGALCARLEETSRRLLMKCRSARKPTGRPAGCVCAFCAALASGNRELIATANDKAQI